MSDPTYLGLDAESLLTIAAGGWADVDLMIGDVKHTFRVVATGNLARRIRAVRVRINGGGHKQKPVGEKELR